MESSHNSAANFARLHGSTTEFRKHFGRELTQNRVLYDRKGVLHKLLSDNLNSTHFSGDTSIVDAIGHVVETRCSTERDEIRTIEQRARNTRKGNAVQGVSESIVQSDATRKLEEALYPPLTKIIDTIDRELAARLGGRKREYYRQFICTGHTPLISQDPTDPSAFKYKPDFAVVECPRPLTGGPLLPPLNKAKELPMEWRHLVSYVEVKSCSLDSPSPTQVPSGTTALCQATDYARSLLVCLPFQLYVYGIILCGHQFCLSWTDRVGVVLSPHYSLLEGEGLRTFIRIVLRLTWELSPSDLGQDPNTAYLEGYKSLGKKTYPSLVVKMGGPDDDHSWTTCENPLWRSHTLFGRGTSVWRVVTAQGLPAVLKVALRTVNRTSELEIYRQMKDLIGERTITGMVNLDMIGGGGDVHFEGASLAIPMTVSALRPKNTVSQEVVDKQLHRIVFYDIGKPLWKFDCPEQLVRAMRMALAAHRDLCSLGILHRDISAGNILIRLSVVRNGGQLDEEEMDAERTEGFLTDFEFASLPRLEAEGPKVAPGDDMTGTMMFMASSLLRAIKDAKPGEAASISRTKEQDIESFGWVFVYVVYMHALAYKPKSEAEVKIPKEKRKALQDEFNQLFPGRSAEFILTARYRIHSPDANKHILEYIEEHIEHPGELGDLFKCIWESILVENLPKANTAHNELRARAMKKLGRAPSQLQPPPTPSLTHDSILSFFDIYFELIGKEV